MSRWADCLPDHHYWLLLQQRREDLLILQAQWPSPLASAARYASRTQDARQLAEEVMGITPTWKVDL